MELEQFIARVHSARSAAGAESLVRDIGMSTRSLYRLHKAHSGLVYFPSVAFASLGLVHVHAFVDEQSPLVSYAVRALWVVRSPGVRSLYVHCLIPAAHMSVIPNDALVTDDGWQALSPNEPIPRVFEAAWDVVERYPLLIPVVFEVLEQRRSMPETWRAIYERLGDRVWQYLPRFSRRLPHNGKAYVREAFRLMNEAGLFRQHVVRQHLSESAEVVLMVNAPMADVLGLLSFDVDVLEVFPGRDTTIVLLQGGIGMINRLFRLRPPIPIRGFYFVDTAEPAPRVRFAYEHLFDPATCQWIGPDDTRTHQASTSTTAETRAGPPRRVHRGNARALSTPTASRGDRDHP